MLGIDFLNHRDTRAGLEFLDFQDSTMFQDLVTELNNNIDINEKGTSATIDEKIAKRIAKIIADNTGFTNFDIIFSSMGNLAIDAAYFSPRHIFNEEYLDMVYPKSDTTLGRWFAQNKGKVFKGDIDYTTGKVSGAYSTLPWRLYINKHPENFVALDKLSSYAVTLGEAIAAGICHEVGHAFSVVMAMHQTFFDNFIIQAAVRQLVEVKKEKDRAIILKDAKQLLDLTDGDDDKETIEKIISGEDQSVTFFYFNKKVNDRNTSRALSAGVKEMSCEVVADMYAVRMGAGRALVAGLSTMIIRGKRYMKSFVWFLAVIYWIFLTVSSFSASIIGGILMGPVILASAVITYLFLRVITFIVGSISELTPGGYNTSYRRFTDVAGQMIQGIKENKEASNSEKMRAILDVEAVIKMADKIKPFFEDTFGQRFIGAFCTLGKFKYTNFEHYTENLINHRVNILSEKFQLGA